jgi:hypothetical protein
MRAFTRDQIIEREDLIEFNREIKDEEILVLEANYFNHLIEVDLTKQTISVDNKLIDLETEKLENVRWINFRRNIINFQMTGEKTHSFSYGIGFQGNLNGENIQRFILVNEKGYKLERKK